MGWQHSETFCAVGQAVVLQEKGRSLLKVLGKQVGDEVERRNSL